MDHGSSAYRRGVIFSVAALFTTLIFFYLFAIDGVPEQITAPFSHQNQQHPEWLIATVSPAHAISRRVIIRETWQKLFAEPSVWTTRFVISAAADPMWQAIIDAENATYGDLIQLSHLEENGRIANTIKTVEFFKYLAPQLEGWKFVTKIDDDSYLDARKFYHDYLRPRQDANRTIIARTIKMTNFTTPGGQFYTLTSDMVALLADLQTQTPILDEAEDVLVGRLLHEADENWMHVNLPNEVAFDYEEVQLREEGKAFAAADADLTGWRHAVGPGSINPHKMRDDKTYVKVAACFDEDGVISQDEIQ